MIPSPLRRIGEQNGCRW